MRNRVQLSWKSMLFPKVCCVFACRFRALLERGLMKRQLQLWRAVPPKCCGASEVQQVQLEATAVALFLLAAGTILSLIVLYIERKLQDNRRKRHCKLRCIPASTELPNKFRTSKLRDTSAGSIL